MGTWRTLHPRRILHALGAISVHRDVLLGEPRTRALRSGTECSSDLHTAGLISMVLRFTAVLQFILYFITFIQPIYVMLKVTVRKKH